MRTGAKEAHTGRHRYEKHSWWKDDDGTREVDREEIKDTKENVEVGTSAD